MPTSVVQNVIHGQFKCSQFFIRWKPMLFVWTASNLDLRIPRFSSEVLEVVIYSLFNWSVFSVSAYRSSAQIPTNDVTDTFVTIIYGSHWRQLVFLGRKNYLVEDINGCFPKNCNFSSLVSPIFVGSSGHYRRQTERTLLFSRILLVPLSALTWVPHLWPLLETLHIQIRSCYFFTVQ